MTKRIPIPEPVTGEGYVGVWADNSLGWGLPDCLQGDIRENPGLWYMTYADDGDRAYLCRITIEPVLDAAGRPIVRVHCKEGA